MKIGLISDTHGNWSSIDQAVSIAQNMDMWLHMGDCTPDAEYLQSLLNVPVYDAEYQIRKNYRRGRPQNFYHART